MGQLALTALVTWYVVGRVGLDWTEFQRLDLAEWQPNLVLLAASAAMLLSAMFMNAALWARVVRDLGGAHIPVKQAVPLFMIANLGRYLPGKVWQIAGLAALASSLSAAFTDPTAATGSATALCAATLRAGTWPERRLPTTCTPPSTMRRRSRCTRRVRSWLALACASTLVL